MQTKVSKLIAVMLFCTVLVFSMAGAVWALSTDEAKEAVDTSALCSLKLTFQASGRDCAGITADLYYVAAADESLTFTPTPAYAGCPVKINGLQSQTEWKELCEAIGSYIVADRKVPDHHAVSAVDGTAAFADLPLGLYYVKPHGGSIPENGFAPFFVTAPSLGDDGHWLYDLCVTPKYSEVPVPYEYTVIKLWDDGTGEGRPDRITLKIFKDGDLFDTVVLSGENNWKYTFKAYHEGVWNVAEENVPDGYTVSVSRTAGSFIVTNTKELPSPPPTDTGDTAHIYFWIAAAFVSGAALLCLGVFALRHE